MAKGKVRDEGQEIFEMYNSNPFWREFHENAPTAASRKYCFMMLHEVSWSPKEAKYRLFEKFFTVEDWEYLAENIGHNPLRSYFVKGAQEARERLERGEGSIPYTEADIDELERVGNKDRSADADTDLHNEKLRRTLVSDLGNYLIEDAITRFHEATPSRREEMWQDVGSAIEYSAARGHDIYVLMEDAEDVNEIDFRNDDVNLSWLDPEIIESIDGRKAMAAFTNQYEADKTESDYARMPLAVLLRLFQLQDEDLEGIVLNVDGEQFVLVPEMIDDMVQDIEGMSEEDCLQLEYKGIHATAWPTRCGLVIMKGSEVNPVIMKSCQKNARNRRARLEAEEVIVDNMFVEDAVFHSYCVAENIITGRNGDGSGFRNPEKEKVMPLEIYDVVQDGVHSFMSAVGFEDELKFSGQDIGKAVSETFGDSDYEYWYALSREDTRRLKEILDELHGEDTLREHIRKHYSGRKGFRKLRELWEEKGIKAKFSSYA